MDISTLENVMYLHRKWVYNIPGGKKADLRGEKLSTLDLRKFDFSHHDLKSTRFKNSDLRGVSFAFASFFGVNLSGADLQGANLDYSSWPLWCGSFGVKICKRIFCQLAYHLCRVIVDDEECKAAQRALRPLANQFHRVKECGEIK